MTTHPTADELLLAVITWLETPQAGADTYMALVARNALAIVQRELRLRPQADAAATTRLIALLNLQAELPTLEQELSARIRTGAIDLTNPTLLDHLRRQTLDRLAIDQPRYRHALPAA